ncbi:MAG: terminase small subunit [Eubacteriales bacterium]|nr:terminase small subunit [Eubacteriales bacterium]
MIKQALWSRVIDEYFQGCDDTKVCIALKNGEQKEWQRPYTLYGLCAALELSAAEVLRYKDGPQSQRHCVLIRNALLKIAAYTLEHALRGDFTWQVATAAIKELGLLPSQETNTDGNELIITMDSAAMEASL